MTAIYAATIRMVRAIFGQLKKAVSIFEENHGAARRGRRGYRHWRPAAIEGIKEIKLFNRKDDFSKKAVAFAKRVNENTDCVVTVTDLADQHAFTEALASADILTNGTKVGMKPLENESLIGDVSLLRPELLVTECVYNPHMTKLLQQAQQAGCKTIDGYGMLLWQGAEQFELWTGKAFPLDYVKQVMGFTA